jgi:coenzyme F420-0:L-glutamate ligase
MPQPYLTVIPIQAPVQKQAFDLNHTLVQAISSAGESLQHGDVIAISSKYTAISEGRVVELAAVTVSETAAALAERYHMNPQVAQLVIQEAEHIFGGIHGFLLTSHHGMIQPNAGIDRSNIPNGFAVLFPADPYESARRIRQGVWKQLGVDVGVVLTDSWLIPGRLGTTGLALAVAGFRPIQDERGKIDLFGNPMQVTQRGIADTLCAAAQLVMGERDEATPIVILRNSGVRLEDVTLSAADVSIDWRMCIYVESLTEGRWDVIFQPQPWPSDTAR